MDSADGEGSSEEIPPTEPLPPWHLRDDTGLVWRLAARGGGIEGREYRLTHVDDREGNS